MAMDLADQTLKDLNAQDYQDDVQVPNLQNMPILTHQMSSDELISNEDILNTEKIIADSKEESDEETVIEFSIIDVMRKGAINLVLPFINGMMLGFGEILAHEIGFRYNWQGAKVEPQRRMERTSKYL